MQANTRFNRTKIITACPGCRAKNMQALFDSADRMLQLPGKFALNKCVTCQLYVLSPRPTSASLVHYYPSQRYYSYRSGEKGVFTRIREYLVAHYYAPTLLSRLISSVIQNVPALPSWSNTRKILDVGCGSGDTLVLLKKLSWKPYGLEIDNAAVAVARKRGLRQVTLGGFEAMKKFKNNSFDAIRLYHVIEHLDDPRTCLNLAYKKLRPGGELIIGTPNSHSLMARLFKSYWYNLDSPRHLIVFSPDVLKTYVIDAGFVRVDVEFCSAGGLAGSLQYVLRDRWGIDINLIHNPAIILLLYPIEWVIDKFQAGDVFVLRARKREENKRG